MSRPVKSRNVCKMPSCCHFGPLDSDSLEIINMTVDEYETIRLIDLEGLNQEECAKQMNVARTTAQGIYLQARKKLAESLVNGKRIMIGGGEYKICEGPNNCGRSCKRMKCMINNEIKERTKMKIAIPADECRKDSTVCMSYGRTPYFAVYDVENKEFTFLDNSAAAESGGAGIKASQMLVDNGVTTVITERLGENAADVLKLAKIDIYEAVKGDIAFNVQEYLQNKLSVLTNIHAGFHMHHKD